MILLPILAVAFAAFCVWLTARIVNRRERWAKWTAVGLAAFLALHPLSAGPAFWADIKLSSYPRPQWLKATVGKLYVPLLAALEYGPDSLRELCNDYVGWWIELAQPSFDEHAMPK